MTVIFPLNTWPLSGLPVYRHFKLFFTHHTCRLPETEQCALFLYKLTKYKRLLVMPWLLAQR